MIVIRQAKQSDVEPICGIFTSSIRVLAADCYSAEQIASWSGAYTLDRCHSAVESGDLFVAELDNEIAGFGQLDLAAGCVEMLYVSPAYVRRGAGSAILKFLEVLATNNGLTSLHLRASLNAVPFYASVGYQEVERIIHCSADSVEFECVNMFKDIKTSE